MAEDIFTINPGSLCGRRGPARVATPLSSSPYRFTWPLSCCPGILGPYTHLRAFTKGFLCQNYSFPIFPRRPWLRRLTSLLPKAPPKHPIYSEGLNSSCSLQSTQAMPRPPAPTKSSGSLGVGLGSPGDSKEQPGLTSGLLHGTLTAVAYLFTSVSASATRIWAQGEGLPLSHSPSVPEPRTVPCV